MSTRCQIAFYESKPKDLNKFEALIYRHSDGYPEGVLPDIEPFLKQWSKNRGIDDIEYCSARLLQHLCNSYDGHMKPVEERNGKEMLFAGILGHGICKGFHSDIEYLYSIYPDKIDVYEISSKCYDKGYNLIDVNKVKKVKSVNL